MTTATASAKLIDPVLQLARHLQQDPQQLLREVGLAPEELSRAGARIPAASFSTLLQALAARSGNPRIPLRAGEVTQPRMLGSVGFLMTTAPTLERALRVLNDYLPLLIEGVHLSFNETEQGAELVLDLQDDSDRALAEWLLACLHNWPRWLIGKQMPLRRVEFAYSRPDAEGLYERFFAAEVRFSARRSRLLFDSEVLNQPCLDASEELHRHHLQFADQLLSSAGRDGALIAQVKSLIRNQLTAGSQAVTRDQVASQLNYSLRTLQRKLDQYGTSFQSLYDQTRRDLALQLIHSSSASFGEIAYQLGFSGLSAFQKAFKRWTGQTPGRYRDNQSPRALLADTRPPRSLQERIAQGRLEERDFYSAALQLTALLREQGGQPRRPLHPALIQVQQGADSQAALRLSPGVADLNAALTLTQELAYRAPESSGLLPTRPGQATRLYELGCLFYFLLHGQPPHASDDLSTLLQMQLQHTPQLERSLSSPLRAILGKLLELEPERRYQSLDGLEQDLHQARETTRGDQAKGFIAGLNDRPPPQPQTEPLIGRESVQDALAQAVQRARRHECTLVLLEGPAGIGKSALVAPLATAAYRSQGHLLLVDFHAGDETRRLDPLLTPIRLFLRQKLAAPAARRELWARQMQRELGAHLPLLGSLLPELAQLTGELPAAPSGLTGRDYLSRQLDAFRALLSQQRDLLVLFFDDLQWASAEALGLVQQLVAQPGSRPLLLVATSTPEALAAGSAAENLLPGLRSHQRSQTHRLRPLSPGELHAAVRTLFAEPDQATHDLSDWLYQRSQGVPGRLVEALLALQADGKLVAAPQAGHWLWLPDPTSEHQTTSPILAAALDELPAGTRELLLWAAAIGERFSLAQLAAARQDPEARIVIHLWPAEEAGILRAGVESQGGGQFSHPGYRTCVLESAEPAMLADVHRQLAAGLLTQPAPSSEALHLAALQLAEAQRLAPQAEARLPLIRAHRNAARQADARQEPPRALFHRRAALALLLPEDLQHQAALALSVWEEGVDALLHAGLWDELAACLTQLDRIPLLDACPGLNALRVQARAELACHREDLDQAQRQLVESLARQGVAIASPGALPRVLHRYLSNPAPAASGGRGDTRTDRLLARLHRLAEARQDPALLLAVLVPIAERSGPEPIVDQALRVFLLQEVASPPDPAPPSATPYLQRRWLEGARCLPWRAPLTQSIAALEDAHTQNLQTRQACPELLLPLFHSRCWSSEPLPAVERALQIELERQGASHPALVQQLRASVLLPVRSLCAEPSASLNHAATGTTSSIRPAGQDAWTLLGTVTTAFLLGDRTRWPRLATQAEQRAPRLGGLLGEAQLLFFTGLIAAELALHGTDTERQRWLGLLLRLQSRFSVWSSAGLPLFEACQALLEAESHALAGKPEQASAAFERAISAADAVPSLLLSALARQRFARFWKRSRHPTLATLLQQVADDYLLQWGAARLVNREAMFAGLTGRDR